ncbi:MAG: hypothetical protein JWQ90_2893 [Hydrocarboniphaga sp.]|uniref:hypothetical protein n=1 Tax=Hydrocarboniphaga sp. TaxID=2033016 RepID=UPI00262A1D02|nr:hypothetical protein [Hydrocarboniphaga sp.]MDB5970443.1 hypothetical protein [Hydrocarboniphaga sp.]
MKNTEEIDMSTGTDLPQDPKPSPPKKPVIQKQTDSFSGKDQLRNQRSPADLEREEANGQQPSGWTTKM